MCRELRIQKRELHDIYCIRFQVSTEKSPTWCCLRVGRARREPKNVGGIEK